MEEGEDQLDSKSHCVIVKENRGILLQFRKKGSNRCLPVQWHKIAWHWFAI
jgi:hypothetical protein